LTKKDVAVLAAARNAAPRSSRQGPGPFSFDKQSAPGASPRAPGSSMGDAKKMPFGPPVSPAATPQADRIAWLPPPPPGADPRIPKAAETPIVGAVPFETQVATHRASVRLPERLNFDDDDSEDEHTLVDPPSFSGDRTTLIRPFPPSGKGR